MEPKLPVDNNGVYESFAWPGGYPLYYLCNDGEALCPSCMNDSSNPIHFDAPDDGWRIVGCDINWEDESLFCAHCNKQIESVYRESP
jgi:hypothetical protein